MNSLSEYIALQPISGMSDMDIITLYFVDNDMEEEALNLLHKLSQIKIEKMKQNLNNIQEWAYHIPSDYLYKNYSLDIATNLHRIELDYIVNGEVTGCRLRWAKANVPKINLPETYFYPCVDWLAEKGIKFANGEDYYGKTNIL